MAESGREDGTVSFKAFARILGERSPSYVTELKAAGRLVLSEDGKRVRVAESLALLRATADPSKAGVVAHHAAARAAVAGSGPDPAGSPPDGGDDPEAAGAPTGDTVADGHARRRAKALADKAETDAKAAERDYQISLGQLLRAADVEQAVRSAVIVFRGALENLPNILAPKLAATSDEGQVRVLLAEAHEHALEELARQFATLGKREDSA